MLVINDTKVLISAYRFIEKNCDLINEFVYRHAVNFGPSPEYYTTQDVTNNILDLMERKNRLINLKLMIDEIVAGLNSADKAIILAKMRFDLSMKSLCEVLQITSMRTAFRRVQTALEHFTIRANNSKFKNKLEYMLDNENWIATMRRSQMETNVCG